MKKLSLVFGLFIGLGLWGCGDADQVPRNQKLDELKTVASKEAYIPAENIECQVLTATLGSEVGVSFRLLGLSRAPILGFESENYDQIELQPINQDGSKLGYMFFSNRYGQSFLLVDISTGVFSLSNIDIKNDRQKNTLRGNCLAFQSNTQ